MTLQRENLTDLATFGIHVHNPEQQCCKCKASIRGQGIFADELCGNCSKIGPRGDRRNRREAMFYTPKSVHVRPPQVVRSRNEYRVQGVLQPQQVMTILWCVVKIDGVLYVGRKDSNYVSLHNTDGSLVRQFGLQLTQEHLGKIYVAQQRSS
jgi:hypothetical protein